MPTERTLFYSCDAYYAVQSNASRIARAVMSFTYKIRDKSKSDTELA